MPQAMQRRFQSFEDYQNAERDADARHEFVDGQIFAKQAGSELHNTVAAELFAPIHQKLPVTCRAWMADMVLKVDQSERIFSYYPDIMVACGENAGDPYFRTNPLLIVEVLSPSTHRTDATEKLTNYSQVPSLLEYIIASEDTPHIRISRRRTDWRPEDFYAGGFFRLESIGLEMSVEHIYRRVRREVRLDAK